MRTSGGSVEPSGREAAHCERERHAQKTERKQCEGDLLNERERHQCAVSGEMEPYKKLLYQIEVVGRERTKNTLVLDRIFFNAHHSKARPLHVDGGDFGRFFNGHQLAFKLSLCGK